MNPRKCTDLAIQFVKDETQKGLCDGTNEEDTIMIKGMAQVGFIVGFGQAERLIIDKACEWLKMHLDEWSQMDDADLENFRKAMEE